MNLQDQVSEDQAAVISAEAVLDAARQKLASDQSLLAESQPHLTALESLQSFVQEKFPELESEVAAFAARIKALV